MKAMASRLQSLLACRTPLWISAKVFLQELSSAVPAERKTISETEDEQQLGLFSAQQENPLRDAVAAVDLDTLTPIEALNKLYELKKML